MSEETEEGSGEFIPEKDPDFVLIPRKKPDWYKWVYGGCPRPTKMGNRRTRTNQEDNLDK